MGNVLVIRIVHKTRQMHTPTNYLLAKMAVSDVITILLLSCHKFTENQLGLVSHKFATFACKALNIVKICIMGFCYTDSSRFRKISPLAKTLQNRTAVKRG